MANLDTSSVEVSAPALSQCLARVGDLEFGPFTLQELTELQSAQSLSDDLEFRVEGTELWWNWRGIAAASLVSSPGELGPLGDWFTRYESAVAGPYTVAEVTALLLSGSLAVAAEIQVGDGLWYPVTALLVAPDAPCNAAQVEARGEPAAATENGIPGADAVPEEVAGANRPPREFLDQKKLDLENWLAKTMPKRSVPVVFAPRSPVKPLEDVIAEAIGRAVVRVAYEAEQAARGLSYPWIWGVLAALGLVTLLVLRAEPRGPDELEIVALRKLKSAHDAIRAVRASQPDEEVWAEFTRELKAELEPLQDALATEKAANAPAKESLYWALEYRLPRILEEGRLTASSAETQFDANLREAERHMQPKTH